MFGFSAPSSVTKHQKGVTQLIVTYTLSHNISKIKGPSISFLISPDKNLESNQTQEARLAYPRLECCAAFPTPLQHSCSTSLHWLLNPSEVVDMGFQVFQIADQGAYFVVLIFCALSSVNAVVLRFLATYRSQRKAGAEDWLSLAAVLLFLARIGVMLDCKASCIWTLIAPGHTRHLIKWNAQLRHRDSHDLSHVINFLRTHHRMFDSVTEA